MYRNKSTLLSAEMKTVGAEWLFFDLLGVRVVGKKKRRRTGDLHSNLSRPMGPATFVIYNSQAEQCFSAAALQLFVRIQNMSIFVLIMIFVFQMCALLSSIALQSFFFYK